MHVCLLGVQCERNYRLHSPSIRRHRRSRQASLRSRSLSLNEHSIQKLQFCSLQSHAPASLPTRSHHQPFTTKHADNRNHPTSHSRCHTHQWARIRQRVLLRCDTIRLSTLRAVESLQRERGIRCIDNKTSIGTDQKLHLRTHRKFQFHLGGIDCCSFSWRSNCVVQEAGRLFDGRYGCC